MARKPEIGNVRLYPDRKLNSSDKLGYYLRFYCPLKGKRIRRLCGTRNRRIARQIERECQRRLIDGRYKESGGAITEADAKTHSARVVAPKQIDDSIPCWSEATDRYRKKLQKRNRKKSLIDTVSRLCIAERIFKLNIGIEDETTELQLNQCLTIDAFDDLEFALLDGRESQKSQRSPNTVNGIMRTVMAFSRFCKERQWIADVPAWRVISVDDVMKGRPVTGEEFERMIESTERIVGEGSKASWVFTMQVLWQSAFRVQDVMEFSWDDANFIHPVWPTKKGEFPTIVIPPAQKNGKFEEIPMLPGLETLLQAVPKSERSGWITNPQPLEYTLKSQKNWFKPSYKDLAGLVPLYSNTAIAKACGVSDKTISKWINQSGLERAQPIQEYGRQIPYSLIRRIKSGSTDKHLNTKSKNGRLTHQHISKIIAQIGEAAGIVVKSPRPGMAGKTKFASAHDLRRGVAQRLINAGVSAETLKVVMRHRDFATTEKYYGARRQAQSAAKEIRRRVELECRNSELVGQLVGQSTETVQLSESELKKLKHLLARI